MNIQITDIKLVVKLIWLLLVGHKILARKYSLIIATEIVPSLPGVQLDTKIIDIIF